MISFLLTGMEPEVPRCEERRPRSRGSAKTRQYIFDFRCRGKGRRGGREFLFVETLSVLTTGLELHVHQHLHLILFSDVGVATSLR